MLSPLYVYNVDTIKEPKTEVVIKKEKTYSEVSIEMIYEGLKRLSVWRQEVSTEDLMTFIQIHYPVNPEKLELFEEVNDKLTVAVYAGIVSEPYQGYWSLTTELQKRHIDVNHVTLFWELYANTMRPIRKKGVQIKVDKKESGQNTSTAKDDLV